MKSLTVETKSNGYKAEGIQNMIGKFETAAAQLFPGCTVRHFYYGDTLDIYWQGSNLDQDINPDELRKLILCPHWEDGLKGATRVNIIKPEYTELESTTVAVFSGKLKVSHKVKD